MKNQLQKTVTPAVHAKDLDFVLLPKQVPTDRKSRRAADREQDALEKVLKPAMADCMEKREKGAISMPDGMIITRQAYFKQMNQKWKDAAHAWNRQTKFWAVNSYAFANIFKEEMK